MNLYKIGGENMRFSLPALLFTKEGLEPYISAQTLTFHYEKHHQTYINNLNNLIANTELENKSLEEIIAISLKDEQKTAIYNNAAQVFNHTFFFKCFKEEFKSAAISQFGSGWAWLGLKDNKLKVFKTSNADNHIKLAFKPILTIDVWEHAYYLDYQNRRADFVEVFLTKLINWDFALSQLLL
jgi:Fe-Mn family superoxide dismutase